MWKDRLPSLFRWLYFPFSGVNSGTPSCWVVWVSFFFDPSLETQPSVLQSSTLIPSHLTYFEVIVKMNIQRSSVHMWCHIVHRCPSWVLLKSMYISKVCVVFLAVTVWGLVMTHGSDIIHFCPSKIELPVGARPRPWLAEEQRMAPTWSTQLT